MNENHIIIYGEIGEGFNGDGNTLKSVKEQIDNNADSYVVHINSQGGDVLEGFAIFDFLKRIGKQKKVTTVVEGMAYSMGSVIALAGSVRLMQANSDFMVHSPVGVAVGTADEVEKVSDQIRFWENRIIETYMQVTGLQRFEAEDLVKNETFLSSEEAIQKRFMTGTANNFKAVAYLNKSKLVSIMEDKSKEQEKKDSFLEKLNAKVDRLLGVKDKEEKQPTELESLKASYSNIEAKNAELIGKLEASEKDKEELAALNATLSEGLTALKAEFEAFKNEPLGKPEAPAQREESEIKASGNPEYAGMDAYINQVVKNY